MKHSLAITLILVGVFFVSQLVGLAVIGQYVAQRTVNETTGEVNITYAGLPLDMQRPEIEANQSYIFILGAVLIGTILVLLLIKFKGFKLWKMWFFLSVALCLTISFYAFTRKLFPDTVPTFIPSGVALVLAVTLATLKIYKPNFIIHNASEVFIYGGLAAIFVPIMNLFAIVILLILISVYDMIAVWQSKHMVKMAQFQTESKVFAGLSIPYEIPKKQEKTEGKNLKTVQVKSAILGGGDIGFPLLFAGVLMKTAGYLKVLVVPIAVSVALFLLLYFAKKDRFYPAMPFITAGCFVGYGILMLL